LRCLDVALNVDQVRRAKNIWRRGIDLGGENIRTQYANIGRDQELGGRRVGLLNGQVANRERGESRRIERILSVEEWWKEGDGGHIEPKRTAGVDIVACNEIHTQTVVAQLNGRGLRRSIDKEAG